MRAPSFERGKRRAAGLATRASSLGQRLNKPLAWPACPHMSPNMHSPRVLAEGAAFPKAKRPRLHPMALRLDRPEPEPGAPREESHEESHERAAKRESHEESREESHERAAQRGVQQRRAHLCGLHLWTGRAGAERRALDLEALGSIVLVVLGSIVLGSGAKLLLDLERGDALTMSNLSGHPRGRRADRAIVAREDWRGEERLLGVR